MARVKCLKCGNIFNQKHNKEKKGTKLIGQWCPKCKAVRTVKVQ